MLDEMEVISNLNEFGSLTTASSKNSGNGSEKFSPLFGMELAMPEWEAITTIVALGTVIVTTIIGKYICKIHDQSLTVIVYN